MARDGKPVLVVDNDPDMRALVEEILGATGYRVLTAGEGQEALAQVRQDPPGLILLDLQLPNMDGQTFTQTLRAQLAPAPPIVLFTALQDASAQAHQLGAAGYVSKPFDLDDLLSTVAWYVEPAA